MTPNPPRGKRKKGKDGKLHPVSPEISDVSAHPREEANKETGGNGKDANGSARYQDVPAYQPITDKQAVIIGAIVAVCTIALLYYTQQQVSDYREFAIKETRAYIGVVDTRKDTLVILIGGERKHFIIARVVVKNYGKIPALNVATGIYYQRWTRNLPAVNPDTLIRTPGGHVFMIEPDATEEIVVQQDTTAWLTSPQTAEQIIGVVHYNDGYRNDRRTVFGYQWESRAGGRFSRLPGMNYGD